MITVAVESTDTIASVAVAKDGAVTGSKICTEKRRHSETLLPLLDELLREQGYTVRDIDAYCVDIGPGSFTGVRIGVSSVNAIASASKRPVIGVSSLDAIYAGAGFPEGALVMIDAGGGRVFACLYQNGERRNGPVAGQRESLISLAEKDTLVLEGRIPEAEDLLKAASRFGSITSFAHPLYIVPSQAERMLAAKRKGTGRTHE